MIISFLRSTIEKYPSESIQPRSPVLSQPSASTSAVSSTAPSTLHDVVPANRDLRQFANEFDSIHDVRRAVRVGSVDQIIAPRNCGRS
jgi:hypothetical protein